MLSVQAGIVTPVRPAQPSNVRSLMRVTPEGSVTRVNPMQP